MPCEAHLLGLGEERVALARSSAPVAADAPVDVNLLRDWAEWRLVSDCVSACDRDGLVLVDGDLQPDWRIPSSWLASLLAQAASQGVALVGVTKHSSLSWGQAPLLGAAGTAGRGRPGPAGPLVGARGARPPGRRLRGSRWWWPD